MHVLNQSNDYGCKPSYPQFHPKSKERRHNSRLQSVKCIDIVKGQLGDNSGLLDKDMLILSTATEGLTKTSGFGLWQGRLSLAGVTTLKFLLEYTERLACRATTDLFRC